MSGVHRDAIQKQIHQDWANREYIEVITASIKRITDFLNSFGEFHWFHEPSPLISHTLFAVMLIRSSLKFADMSCRSRLAVLNEKLTVLERRIDYLEACVTKGETLT